MPTTTAHSNVKSTTNYGLFTLLSANREIGQGHVNALKESIERLGNITEHVPIIVNQDLQIIDGQHRFTALKELGLPVYYIVATGMDINHAREMNILNKGWTPMDYAKSYADEGRQNYAKYLYLRDTYPHIAHASILTLAAGSDAAGLYVAFRRGEFVIRDLNTVLKYCDMLAELIELSPAFTSRAVVRAMVRVFALEGYDHKRMLAKVTANLPKIQPYQKVEDNLRLLEDVYNDYARSNRLRFF